MENLFEQYTVLNDIYNEKNQTYEMLKCYCYDIVHSNFHNMMLVNPVISEICLDYIDYVEYNDLVSKEFINSYREFNDYMDNLQKDINRIFNLRKTVGEKIVYYAQVSLDDFIYLLKTFNIPFKQNLIDGIKVINAQDKCYIVTSTVNNLIFAEDGEIVYNPILNMFLNPELEEFIKFYVNYQNKAEEKLSLIAVHEGYLANLKQNSLR